MNNENKFTRNFGEVMANTYITKWFSDMQGAMKLSEVKEGSYDYRFVDSNVGAGGVNNGGKFNFRFQAGRFEVISLENSYIYCKQQIPITVPKSDDSYVKSYTVGYRNSAAIFNQYIIRSDTQVLYQNNNACYEWFLDRTSVADAAARNDETYADLQKVRRDDPGTFTEAHVGGITAEKKILVTLHLRIPLMRWITFRSLKWMLDWKGPFDFELFPTNENVLVCPIIPNEIIKTNKIQTAVDTYNNTVIAGSSCKPEDIFCLDFFHLNQKVANKFNIHPDTGAVNILDNPFQEWKSDNQTTYEARLHLARFTLREDVYNMLLAEYSKSPLLLPVQCTSYKDFNTAIGNVNEFGVTTQITFKRSNAGVVLFREDGIRSKQRFVNPCIGYQFAIGGLPNPIPSTKYYSIGDQRHS